MATLAERGEISFLEIVAVVLMRWRIVAAVTVAGLLGAVAISLYVPARPGVTSTIEVGMVGGNTVEPMPAVQHFAKTIAIADRIDASFRTVGSMLVISTTGESVDAQMVWHHRVAALLAERHNRAMIPGAVALKSRVNGVDVTSRPTVQLIVLEDAKAVNRLQLVVAVGICAFVAGCLLALLVHIWQPLCQRLRDSMDAAAAGR